MNVVRAAVRFPVSTAVGVILVVLFGSLALFRIPIQLTPTVDDATVSVSTVWPGASPLEVEREIVQEQEEQLKSVEGMLRMESTSSDSNGRITLYFPAGTDLDAAALRVSNRLQQVPEYPEDAEKPVITTVGFDEGAIAYFAVQPLPAYAGRIEEEFHFVDDQVKPEIERVEGIGFANVFGGRDRELQVIVDPAQLAARQVTWGELGAALERENRNYSGGDFDEGKRRYVVRTIGEYASPEDVENIVIAVRDGVPIYLRDVGRAELGFRKARARVFQLDQQVIVMNAIQVPGTNLLDVMERLKARVAQLNETLLKDRNLVVVQVYDETEYVESAIALVQQSLMLGGVLAVMVLLVFLRSASSTLVIAVAIPISIVGTFLLMYLFGRTINVISLAGMAFAVGMVVDNAIVVLENIYRHRQRGDARFQAAEQGAREVWGAVLASTLTTVAVFVPIAFVVEEAGQLFGDIAVAISCAVVLSLIVSVTVIPSLSARILSAASAEDEAAGGFHGLWGGVALARRVGERIGESVAWINASLRRRLVTVFALTTAAVVLSAALVPDTEYLPIGNNNFLFGILLPPPGHNLEENVELREGIASVLRPMWQAEPGSPEAQALPGGGVRSFFYVALPNQVFMGSRARDPQRSRALLPVFQDAMGSLPGTIGVINQSSIFQQGFDEGRNIDVEVTGPDLGRLMALAGEIFGRIRQALPRAQARPIPGLDLDNPEVSVVTHRRRASELGLSNRDLGFAVSAMVDGAKASDYQYQGREVDLRVMTAERDDHRTHLLEQLPLATPDGRLVTLGTVAEVRESNGPVSINHRERQRAVTLRVTPEEDRPLEAAMRTLEEEVLAPMRTDGRIPGAYRVSLTGTADKLVETVATLRFNFVLAVVITYLLMAALFESFLHPLVIMFSVPLAALGGFLGLAVVHVFTGQKLDVLTMLGFIVLVGTVVNNAILIVHQALNLIHGHGMEPRTAIRVSVEGRVRPIFMSVSTSVCGMLPLVLFPGSGSELYRGLGAVVVGGLVVSTVFTLFLVPALFSLVLDAREALAARIAALKPAGGTDSSG